MYSSLYKKFQKSDKNVTMWFAGTEITNWLTLRVFGYQLISLVRNVGFDIPPGGETGSDMHVFHAHSYCCVLGFEVCLGGEPAKEFADDCAAWHKKVVNKRTEDAERLGVPFVLSEFGACKNTEECGREIT